MVFIVFKCYCTLVVSQNEHCQSSVTLPQCETFCKLYNLPIHYSHKQSHCCCKDDIESSTPGYVVIWDEGKFQPPRGARWKKFFQKLRKVHTKTPLPEPFFNKGASACNFIKKEALAQVLFCELCDISQNKTPFLTEFPVAASFQNKASY